MSGGALVLRPLRDDEGEALADLWIDSWRATFPDIDFEARRGWLATHLARLVRQGAQLVCAADGAGLRGFVTIDPATGWLDQLCVARDAFGAGVATALLNEAKRLSPRRVGLDVAADNGRALRFYEREGFARVGPGAPSPSGRATLVMEWRPA